MTTRNYLYSGSNLLQDSANFSNYGVDDNYGMIYTPSTPPSDTDSVVGTAYHTHNSIESPDVLWMGVKLNLTHSSSAATPTYKNVISLYGFNNGHVQELIGEKVYTSINSTPTTVKVNFDLLSSACQASFITTNTTSTTSGAFTVNLPMRYTNHYSDAYCTREWYDTSNWPKRKAVPLTGGTTQIGYQLVAVPLAYDSDMAADFSDIRFTDRDSTTLLNHYLLKKTDSTSAVYVVAVPDLIQTQTSNIYAYYGNSSTPSASTDTIFEDYTTYYSVFDNFEDGNVTGWTQGPAGTLAVESATPVVDTYSLKYTGNGSDNNDNIFYRAVSAAPRSVEFEFQVLTQGVGANTPYVFLWNTQLYNSSNFVRVDTYYNSGDNKQKLRAIKTVGGSATAITTVDWLTGKIPVNTPYTFKILDTGTNIKVYIDGVGMINSNYTYAGTAGTQHGGGSNMDTVAVWDNIRITSYSPTLGTVASEESATYNTVTPNTPAENDTYLTFTTPTDWVDRTPLTMTITEYDSSAYTTRPVYVNDDSTLQLGYDGLDSYNTLRVGVETTTTSTPYTVKLNDIEYIYEV
jgi:hypothetical protein